MTAKIRTLVHFYVLPIHVPIPESYVPIFQILRLEARYRKSNPKYQIASRPDILNIDRVDNEYFRSINIHWIFTIYE